MVNCWVFSSKNRENIRVASERLVWGFWDKSSARKDKASKLVRNWRMFIRLYNRISQGDLAFFQVVGTGEIHALGVVKDKYYDDQTPIWDLELKKKKVLYPWRVSFYLIIYSEEPLTQHYVEIGNYVDGYGIGELAHHYAKRILSELEKRYHFTLNVSL